MKFNLSESNPDHERIKEQGYAYVLVSAIQPVSQPDKCGAPFADVDSRASPAASIDDERLRIITW